MKKRIIVSIVFAGLIVVATGCDKDDTNKSSNNTQSSVSSVSEPAFDRAHAGFSGGTYIYYYFECKNSKHTTKKNVSYCIIKR